MTRLPFHMNWNFIRITRLRLQPTTDDSHFRENVGSKVFETEVTIRAQITFRKMDDRSRTWTGNEDTSDGRIVIKQSDLTTWTPKRGDRITGIMKYDRTWKTVDYEITQVMDRGHLPASLIMFCEFKERSETRGSN